MGEDKLNWPSRQLLTRDSDRASARGIVRGIVRGESEGVTHLNDAGVGVGRLFAPRKAAAEGGGGGQTDRLAERLHRQGIDDFAQFKRSRPQSPGEASVPSTECGEIVRAPEAKAEHAVCSGTSCSPRATARFNWRTRRGHGAKKRLVDKKCTARFSGRTRSDREKLGCRESGCRGECGPYQKKIDRVRSIHRNFDRQKTSERAAGVRPNWNDVRGPSSSQSHRSFDRESLADFGLNLPLLKSSSAMRSLSMFEEH